MAIGFSTAALFPRPTLAALKLIEACGFTFAELMPQCRRETRPSFTRLREWRRLKIRVWSVHFPLVFSSTFYNPYRGMRREAARLINDVVQMSALLQAKVIVIHPPNEVPEDVGKLFQPPIIQNLRHLCDKAAERGIAVAVENSPRSQCKSPAGMVAFLAELGHRNAYPMLDTTEAAEAGYDPVDFLSVVNPIHLHLSDYRASTVHLPVGEGEIEWKKIIECLHLRNYSGCLVIEPAYRYFVSQEQAIDKMIKMKAFIANLWKEK